MKIRWSLYEDNNTKALEYVDLDILPVSGNKIRIDIKGDEREFKVWHTLFVDSHSMNEGYCILQRLQELNIKEDKYFLFHGHLNQNAPDNYTIEVNGKDNIEICGIPKADEDSIKIGDKSSRNIKTFLECLAAQV